MNAFAAARDKVGNMARSQRREYAGEADRPLGGYALTMTTYAGVIGAIATAVRATGREIPDGIDPKDVALLSLATHKLSRLLAKDPVTSPLRAPFTAYQGTSGPAELSEEVRGSGVQKTVGELVTCPFCTGIWVATGFTAGLIFVPRATRIAIGTFAALAGADMLQFGHVWLQKAAES